MDVFKTIWDSIKTCFLRFVWEPIRQMDLIDAVDILALAVILYILYRFFRTRRAGRVLIGISAVVVFSVLIVLLELPALTYIVRLFFSAVFFCVIVIFQPEIRDALENLGNLTFLNPFSNRLPNRRMAEAKHMTDETVEAVCAMSESHTGALIVFEGLTKLGDYIQSGKPLDAAVSNELLQTVFYDKAPLHDGAVIIRDMRICAASCVLPSTTRSHSDFENLGTRHRAAVGITEVSDALVVVVSEQTGTVSVAQNGRLLRELDGKTLREILMFYVAGKTYSRQKRANLRRDYLQMLEEAGRVETPVAPANSNQEAVDKEFERLFGSSVEKKAEPTEAHSEEPYPEEQQEESDAHKSRKEKDS